MRNVTRAAQVMFGADADPLLVRVLNMLAVGGTQFPDLLPVARDVRGLPYAEVVEVCSSSTSWNSVAQALSGTVAQASICWANELVDVLASSFEPTSLPGSKDAPSTPQFAMGAFLGLFRAGVWLDVNWGVSTTFEKRLTARLPGMILSTELMMVKADSLISKEYEQELSRAIKAWARPEDPSYCNRGHRLAQYQELVQKLADELRKTGSATASESPQPKLRDLVLDQLAYAQFGAISPLGRIIAMSALFKDMDRFMWETTPHASPAR